MTPATTLELEPNKPCDQGKKAKLADATTGNVDSLSHDTEYFDAIDHATIHEGQLKGLRAYYKRR